MIRDIVSPLLLFLVLALIQGCTCTAPAEPGPSSTALPSPTSGPTEPAAPLVRGEPKDLIIQVKDLPAGFQTVEEVPHGPDGHTAFYVRPEAFASEEVGDGNLLAVAVNLTIHDSAAEAEEAYEEEGDLDEGSLAQAMGQASQEATVIDVAPHPAALEKAHEVIAFRVLYEIGTMPVVDYRYRFVVGNTVANVVATARARAAGQDPPGLADQAQTIAERQESRLVEASQ